MQTACGDDEQLNEQKKEERKRRQRTFVIPWHTKWNDSKHFFRNLIPKIHRLLNFETEKFRKHFLMNYKQRMAATEVLPKKKNL